MCVSTKNTILLQTAKAVIYRPNNPHRRMTVRIILHGGSQRSHVTERVKNNMKLQVSHLESLTIKPFSSSNGTHQSCEVVNYGKPKFKAKHTFTFYKFSQDQALFLITINKAIQDQALFGMTRSRITSCTTTNKLKHSF